MGGDRIANSLKNFLFGSFSQIAALALSFVVRSVFIHYLDISFLGLNGLFTNILTVLSLAELGFGSAMIYSLYQPLAYGDSNKIAAYMQFYSKVYVAIGVTVGVIGLSLIPFLGYLVKENVDRFDNFILIYILFLTESVTSYFFAYKRSILNADQKSYICSWWHFVFLVIRSLLQIILLVSYANFVLYIVIQILSTIGENIYISSKVNALYPYLKYKHDITLTREELANIKKNVYALILSNFSRVALKGTSNILISVCVGVTIVGIYSNYIMITGALVMILSQVFSALTGSVGNYIAKEDPRRFIDLFMRLDFLNFWLYGITSICIYVFINPFIGFWIGDEYLLDKSVVIVITINFLLEGFLYSLWLFRSTMGLFVQGKYRPVFTAAINLVLAILLGKYLGLIGVLLGTTFARLLVNVWYDPYVIFKYGFKVSVRNYYIEYLKRVLLILIVSIMCEYLYSNILNVNSFALFFIALALVFLLINILFSIMYRRNPYLSYYMIVFNKSIANLLCK